MYPSPIQRYKTLAVDVFNAHIIRGLEMVETFAGGKAALEQRPDEVEGDADGKDRNLLFMLNI